MKAKTPELKFRYFDIETFDPASEGDPPGPWFHYAVIWDKDNGNRRFTSVKKFLEALFDQGEDPAVSYVIIAHNGLGYDLPVLLPIMQALGWNTNATRKNRRDDKRLHKLASNRWELYERSRYSDGTPANPVFALDSKDKMAGSLASWGKYIGLPKGETPICRTKVEVTEEFWKYCERDVEILRKSYELIDGEGDVRAGLLTVASSTRAIIKDKLGEKRNNGLRRMRMERVEGSIPPKYLDAVTDLLTKHMKRCSTRALNYSSRARRSEKRQAHNYYQHLAVSLMTDEARRLADRIDSGQDLSASDMVRWNTLRAPKELVHGLLPTCIQSHSGPADAEDAHQREVEKLIGESQRAHSDARQALKGGLSRPFNMRDEYSLHYPRLVGEGYVYDVNSMYPYILMEWPIATKFEGRFTGIDPTEQVMQNGWEWVARVKLKASLKEGRHSLMKLGTSMSQELHRQGKSRDGAEYYLDELDWDGEEFNLTSIEYYQILKKDWIIDKLEFIETLFFSVDKKFQKATRETIEEGLWLKNNSPKGSPEYLRGKLIINNIWGRWAMTTKWVLQEEDIVDIGDKNAPAAGAVFTTARGRAILAEVIRAFPEQIRYCDTDSVHLEGVPPEMFEAAGFKVDSKELGAWDCETHFTSARYLKSKTYCLKAVDSNGEEYLKFTTAGSEFLDDAPDPADFTFGWRGRVITKRTMPDGRPSLIEGFKYIDDTTFGHYD